jgi:hypothetical protein
MTASCNVVTRHDGSRQCQVMSLSLIDICLTSISALFTTLLAPTFRARYSLHSTLRRDIWNGQKPIVTWNLMGSNTQYVQSTYHPNLRGLTTNYDAPTTLWLIYSSYNSEVQYCSNSVLSFHLVWSICIRRSDCSKHHKFKATVTRKRRAKLQPDK